MHSWLVYITNDMRDETFIVRSDDIGGALYAAEEYLEDGGYSSNWWIYTIEVQ